MRKRSRDRILIAPAHFTLGAGSGSESHTAAKIIRDLATAFDVDVITGHMTGALDLPRHVAIVQLYPEKLPQWTHTRRLKFLWDAACMAKQMAAFTSYAALIHIFPFDHHHGSFLPFIIPRLPLIVGPLTLPIDLLQYPDEASGFASASGASNVLLRTRVIAARAALPITGFLSAATIHHATAVVAESKASLRYWAGIGEQENWSVIYNALEPQFTYKKRPLRQGTTIITVGNLFRRKGMDRCIAVLHALLPRFHHPIRLVIVGDGPERRRLEKLSNKNVRFIGRIPKEKMPPFYHEADLCLVLPRQEAFANTAMEAMATGIPVVATAVGAMREIIDDGTTGFLVPNDNVRLMVDRTAELVGAVALRQRMGRAAARAVRLKFDRRIIRNRWIHVALHIAP